jgi:hypothetical protein
MVVDNNHETEQSMKKIKKREEKRAHISLNCPCCPSENHPNIGTQFGIVGRIATKMVVVFTDAAM